jgi:hypothetical protein
VVAQDHFAVEIAMKKSDAAMLIRAIARQVKAQLAKRDEKIATLQARIDSLEKKLAKLVD